MDSIPSRPGLGCGPAMIGSAVRKVKLSVLRLLHRMGVITLLTSRECGQGLMSEVKAADTARV